MENAEFLILTSNGECEIDLVVLPLRINTLCGNPKFQSLKNWTFFDSFFQFSFRIFNKFMVSIQMLDHLYNLASVVRGDKKSNTMTDFSAEISILANYHFCQLLLRSYCFAFKSTSFFVSFSLILWSGRGREKRINYVNNLIHPQVFNLF